MGRSAECGSNWFGAWGTTHQDSHISSELMRIAIFGAGGVGGYFGARLAQTEARVNFIARGPHLRAMQTRGLRVDTVKGNFEVSTVQAYQEPKDVGPVDVVIVTTKAWQLAAAAESMQPMLGPETFVVPLQNGVEAPQQLIEVLGPERVLGGFCRIISYIEGPGHITHAGGEPYVAFGELDNRPSERVEQLKQVFRACQRVTVEVPDNIQAAMWGKFLQISAWSGIGALTRVPVGVWREMQETRQMWINAMREVLAVAQAHAVTLSESDIEQAISWVDNLQPMSTASMQRDIMAGRPSELNTLSGAVVRLGLKVGVETPVNSFIYHTLLLQEMHARSKREP